MKGATRFLWQVLIFSNACNSAISWCIINIWWRWLVTNRKKLGQWFFRKCVSMMWQVLIDPINYWEQTTWISMPGARHVITFASCVRIKFTFKRNSIRFFGSSSFYRIRIATSFTRASRYIHTTKVWLRAKQSDTEMKEGVGERHQG